MQKSSKIILAGLMALTMAFSAGSALGTTVHKKVVKKTVRKSSIVRKAVTIYPITTKTAGTFTVTNVKTVSKVAGFEKVTIKPSATAALKTFTDLVPVIPTVKALGGTATIANNVVTINFDGTTSTLVLNYNTNAFKVGTGTATVYYAKLVDLTSKLATNYGDGNVPVIGNPTGNSIIRMSAAEVGEQWLAGGHSKTDSAEFSSPLNSDSCIRCHDGRAFNLVKVDPVTKITTAPTKAQLPNYGEDNHRVIQKITCKVCHTNSASAADYGDNAADGQAFLNTYYGVAEGQTAAVPQRAADLVTSGNTAVLVNGLRLEGVGKSALCISCHESRKPANKALFQAPHAANESDIVFGYGAFNDFDNDGSPDFSLPAAPHAASEKVCVGCHMAPKNGVANHELTVSDNVNNACNVCHTGLTSIERRAYGDYDGNKVVQSVATEIAGLQNAVKAKLLEVAKGVIDTQIAAGTIDVDIDAAGPDTGVAISGLSADFATTYPDGIYTFTSANYPVDVVGGGSLKYATPVVDPAAATNAEKDNQALTTYLIKAQVSPLLYGAGYNYVSTTSDGSKGIHNPGYIVKLLQESYKALNGGKALPGAYLR